MYLCIVKSFKFAPLQLKYAFATTNHSNQALFNFNVFLHIQTTCMTFNTLNYTEPIQINTQLHHICNQALETLKLTLTTSKCAFVDLQCSKPPNTNRYFKCAPMHLQYKAPQNASLNTIISQDPLPN